MKFYEDLVSSICDGYDQAFDHLRRNLIRTAYIGIVLGLLLVSLFATKVVGIAKDSMEVREYKVNHWQK